MGVRSIWSIFHALTREETIYRGIMDIRGRVSCAHRAPGRGERKSALPVRVDVGYEMIGN